MSNDEIKKFNAVRGSTATECECLARDFRLNKMICLILEAS